MPKQWTNITKKPHHLHKIKINLQTESSISLGITKPLKFIILGVELHLDRTNHH